MFALSPKARWQARIAGLVCAAYGTAMFATHAYVKAHQSHRASPVVFKHPVTPVPRKHSSKQDATKTSRAWGTAAKSPASAVTTSEQTQRAMSSPAPGPPGGGQAVGPTEAIPASAAAPATMAAPAVIVLGGGTAPNSQDPVPASAPGMVPRPRSVVREPVAPGQRPPNSPGLYGNRPPPQIPRGAPRAAGGNRPPAPPPRHK